MSYRDLDELLSERRCVRCGQLLDRCGAHCESCMTALQQEIEEEENKRIRSSMSNAPIYSTAQAKDDRQYSTLETWAFLNREFEKLFKK